MPKENPQDNFKLRNEEVQDILTKVPHWMIRYGNLLFLAMIFILLFLSWLIKYPDIITAKATITTKIPPQKVYAKATKGIDSIFVRQAELVSPGQTLAVLENPAKYIDVMQLKKTLDTITTTQGQFFYPIHKLPPLLLGRIGDSYAIFENNYIAYHLYQHLTPYKSEMTASQVNRRELRHRLTNLKAQITFKQAEIEFKKRNLNRNKHLFHKGVISELDYEKSQIAYLSAQRTLKNLISSRYQIKQSLASNQKTTRGITIDKTTKEKMLLKKVVQSFHLLKKEIRRWEFDFVLQSEITGHVYFFNRWNSNQSVKQGDLMFSVIPRKSSRYIAQLKVPVRNSGKIEIGQNVLIKLQNFPYTEYGILEGNVHRISKIPNEKGGYLVNVRLPKKLITSYGNQIHFRGEMLGTAEIITQDVRLIARFFYQFKELLQRE